MLNKQWTLAYASPEAAAVDRARLGMEDAGRQWQWSPALSAYLAGVVAGVSEAATEHPLDTIKTRLQAGVAVGRPLSWLAGITPACCRGVVAGGVFYGANDTFKVAVGATNKEPFALEFLGASVLTACAEALLFCPLETVKVHMQMEGGEAQKQPLPKGEVMETRRQTSAWREQQQQQHGSGWGRGGRGLKPRQPTTLGAVQLARLLGADGLVMGMGPLFASHAMANVVFFSSYNALRNYLSTEESGGTGDGDVAGAGGGAGGDGAGSTDALAHSMPGATAVAGGITSCAYIVAGHPMDTVATHMMAQKRSKELYTGTMHCMTSLVQRYGVASLMRGVLPAALSGIPGGAAAMVAFEWIMSASQQQY